MKLSFVISLQPTRFDCMVNNVNWQKKMRLLSELGYDGVELSIRNPKDVDIRLIEKLLNKYDMAVSAIGTGQAYIDEGLSLSSLRKEIRIKAIKRIKEHIALANYFRSQVIIGLIRGKLSKVEDHRGHGAKNLSDSMREICDCAILKNVIIAIEPLNRYETTFLNNVAQTISFLKKLKCKNLKMLLDTFHMNIEEDSFIEPIENAFSYLSHLHFADNNRRCPGEGRINFREIISKLKQLRYRGYLSGEMLVIGGYEHCIKKFFKMFKSYLGENCGQ